MKKLLCVFLLCVVAQTSLGQTPHEERRNRRQQQRINQGEQSGALNSQETATLEKREEHIDSKEESAKTPAQKARVQRMQNRESRAIVRKKHNDR